MQVRWPLILGGVMGLSAVESSAQTLIGPAITAEELKWIEVPSLPQMAQIRDVFGPSRGSAVIECTINKQRRPRKCVVLQEQFSGDGRRASRLAQLFQASTEYKGETSLEGKKVTFTFDFKPRPGSL